MRLSYLQDLESPPIERLALGIFQEMRSLPDNLYSYKKYIVDPFIAQGIPVDIYIVLSVHDGNRLGPSEHAEMDDLLTQSLIQTGLIEHVVHREEYIIAHQDLGFMRKFDVISTNNTIVNEKFAIFHQYKARDRLGKAMLAHIEEYEQTGVLVMYLRSDVVFYFSQCELDTSVATSNTNAVKTLWDDIQPHMHLMNTSMSIQQDSEGWFGWHDRWHILTQSAFEKYAPTLWGDFREYLRSGHQICGEAIHEFLTRKATNNTYFRPIQVCYGVRRAIFMDRRCEWMDYGFKGCHALGLRPLRFIYNEKNFLPSLIKQRICNYNQLLQKDT